MLKRTKFSLLIKRRDERFSVPLKSRVWKYRQGRYH